MGFQDLVRILDTCDDLPFNMSTNVKLMEQRAASQKQVIEKLEVKIEKIEEDLNQVQLNSQELRQMRTDLNQQNAMMREVYQWVLRQQGETHEQVSFCDLDLEFIFDVGLNAKSDQENVDIGFKRDDEVVQVKSVAQEQAKIISDMRQEVEELHEMTCQITHMLKGTGEHKYVRCKIRDNRDGQSTSRSRDTHRGGNGFDLTVTAERKSTP